MVSSEIETVTFLFWNKLFLVGTIVILLSVFEKTFPTMSYRGGVVVIDDFFMKSPESEGYVTLVREKIRKKIRPVMRNMEK